MNERIKKLYTEASEWALHNYPPPVNPFEWEKLRSKKFAELIVGECIECADFVGQVNIASGYPNSTAHHVKQKIKQHFGVEE